MQSRQPTWCFIFGIKDLTCCIRRRMMTRAQVCCQVCRVLVPGRLSPKSNGCCRCSSIKRSAVCLVGFSCESVTNSMKEGVAALYGKCQIQQQDMACADMCNVQYCIVYKIIGVCVILSGKGSSNLHHSTIAQTTKVGGGGGGGILILKINRNMKQIIFKKTATLTCPQKNGNKTILIGTTTVR